MQLVSTCTFCGTAYLVHRTANGQAQPLDCTASQSGCTMHRTYTRQMPSLLELFRLQHTSWPLPHIVGVVNAANLFKALAAARSEKQNDTIGRPNCSFGDGRIPVFRKAKVKYT
ncbi:hypothetical protein NPIL_611491 [Nephila pilipes]|uniref:Uncharacterized protein n=1 Tax=Nephila pilipes TaxID=299642 RepID=A0A8X6TY10_NEPPI|nr:hypothetical protein NPIL_611491 [Nephila pilipes]